MNKEFELKEFFGVRHETPDPCCVAKFADVTWVTLNFLIESKFWQKLLYCCLETYGLLHGELRPARAPDQHHLLVRVHDAQRVRGEDHPGYLCHVEHDSVPDGGYRTTSVNRHNIHYK